MAIGDWDQRQLCADGSCIGVIGPSGQCKTCGRAAPDWGDERRRGMVAPADGAGVDEDEDDGEDDQDEIAPSAPAELGERGEWRKRQLCSDGGCVGVIGADGACKVCGKTADGDAADDDRDEVDEDDEDEGDEDEDGDEDEGGEDGDEDGDDDEDDDGAEDEDDEDDDGDGPDARTAADGDRSEDGDDAADRKLCPDGACVGLIGRDGRCKICRKEAA